MLFRFILPLILLCAWHQPGVARSYDDIIDSGYIEIAVYNDFPPYSFKQEGEPQGVDVELAKLIARELGVELRWFWFNADETLEDDLRNAVWKGHYLERRIADIMMRVPYDPEFSRMVDGYGNMKNEMVVMFGPYQSERWWIARDPDKTGDIRTLANFQYLPVGVEIDTLPDFFLTGVWGGRLRNNVGHYRDTFLALDDMQSGKLAAVIGTRSQVEWGLRNADKDYDLSADGLQMIGKQAWDIGLAVRHNFRQLAYTVEDIIARLVREGEVARIFEGFGLTYDQPSIYQ